MNLRPEVWLSLGILFGGALALAVGAWWWLAVLALVLATALPGRRAWLNFLVALFAGAALYALAALWVKDGDSNLDSMIAELFKLGSAGALLAVVALVGGLTTGLSALTGSYLRQVIKPAQG